MKWVDSADCTVCGREDTRCLVCEDNDFHGEHDPHRIYHTTCDVCSGWIGNLVRAESERDKLNYLALALAEFRWELRDIILGKAKKK